MKVFLKLLQNIEGGFDRKEMLGVVVSDHSSSNDVRCSNTLFSEGAVRSSSLNPPFSASISKLELRLALTPRSIEPFSRHMYDLRCVMLVCFISQFLLLGSNFLLSAQQCQENARYFVIKVDHHQPRSCPSPSTSEHIRAVDVGMFYPFRVAPLFGFGWFLKTLLFLVPFYPPLFPIYSTSVVDVAVHSQHQRHSCLIELIPP